MSLGLEALAWLSRRFSEWRRSGRWCLLLPGARRGGTQKTRRGRPRRSGRRCRTRGRVQLTGPSVSIHELNKMPPGGRTPVARVRDVRTPGLATGRPLATSVKPAAPLPGVSCSGRHTGARAIDFTAARTRGGGGHVQSPRPVTRRFAPGADRRNGHPAVDCSLAPQHPVHARRLIRSRGISSNRMHREPQVATTDRLQFDQRFLLV